ncbi:hypothetical protein LshimejAT787_0112170 [Lyophyllum shimeji]|uniref:CxC2-like cysteine cluster KDZ transposase-associated domain-containing protein n=1 Tax=Lyophyllum shimeji TaxID=47721 RepID=A0A9P3PEC3_LYOSH|nr:hypothetical protein LshimejAT787_0112170 [Lyophyllum shimeji]
MDNFYRELRRLSRGWRWLKKLQWSGVGQAGKGINDVGEGELAIFCPTCPQPEINLPPDWQSDKNWKVYIRQLTADGNFKADHVRQKAGDADIWLSEGAGMMWTREKVQAFLNAAIVTKTKAPCDNQFRVIEQAMLLSKACDVTGIVAIACARHGCFAPNSLTYVLDPGGFWIPPAHPAGLRTSPAGLRTSPPASVLVPPDSPFLHRRIPDSRLIVAPRAPHITIQFLQGLLRLVLFGSPLASFV